MGDSRHSAAAPPMQWRGAQTNSPESGAEERGDEHSRHAVELDEVLHDEERRDLVRLVDDALGLGVAAPVVGVDHEAGEDGRAQHDREEEGGEEEGPAQREVCID